MDYVLDACAMIAFLNGEAGAETVTELLFQARAGTNRLFMSRIQVLEVYTKDDEIKPAEEAGEFSVLWLK